MRFGWLGFLGLQPKLSPGGLTARSFGAGGSGALWLAGQNAGSETGATLEGEEVVTRDGGRGSASRSKLEVREDSRAPLLTWQGRHNWLQTRAPSAGWAVCCGC